MPRNSTESDQLAALMRAATTGVLVLDRRRRVVHANAEALRILGFDGDPVDRKITKVTRDAALTDLIESAIDDGEQGREELALPSGPVRDVAVSVEPVLDSGGAIVVLRDRTEVRRLERMRQDFVANVSHELRTPITAVLGWAETLADAEGLDLPEFAADGLDTIKRHGRRLAALVDDLLTLSRAESIGLEHGLSPSDLRPIVADAIDAHRDEIDAKRMIVHVEIAPDCERLPTEPRALQTVLRNLIQNAVRYTPEGGTVWVRAESGSKGRMNLYVEDTGPGIEEEHLPRLFERFYRVDPGRSRQEGGTGLGLAIVKHFAMALGGDVKVTSRMGVGTRFRIRVPVRRWEPEAD